MIPYILALISPLFYSVSNFIDKYTLDGYFEEHSIKTYMAAIGVAGLPFVIIFGTLAFDNVGLISPRNIVLAMLSGTLFNAGIAVYLYALNKSDTSLTASLFQLIVVFNYIFGYFFLGEKMSGISALFAFMVLFGGILLAVENEESGRTIRHQILFYMLGSCALISLSDVAFKSSATDGGSYITTQFFEYATTVVIGGLILASNLTVRHESKKLAKQGGIGILAILLVNELVNLIATFMQRYSSVHINLTVMQTLLGIQPVYLIILGYALTKLWPKKFKENILRKNLVSKSIAITIMITGTIGIVFSTHFN